MDHFEAKTDDIEPVDQEAITRYGSLPVIHVQVVPIILLAADHTTIVVVGFLRFVDFVVAT